MTPNPYHYSIVQCRDLSYAGERRNVGLLVVSPSLGKAWLRRGRLGQRAHLIGDDAAFVRSLLDLLDEEAAQVAREGSAAVVHGWLRSRSRPSEDALVLTEPAMGIAEDIPAEVRRLRERYLGRGGGGGRTAAEKLRDDVLRAHGIHGSFAPRSFPSGPATWGFPKVAGVGRRIVVLNALDFSQTKPEGVLDAAFRNIGRASEVTTFHPGVQWLTVATGPSHGAVGRAYTRTRQLMTDAGLNVVAPTADHLEAALVRLGMLQSDGTALEA